MPVFIHAAGCTNTCRHCGAEGRPPHGALFSLGEVRAIAHEWGLLVIYFELSAHPDFPEIMHPDVNDGEDVLATNGFGLARCADSDAVFARLREFGYTGVSHTLHSIGDNHDWFVARRGAYQDIITSSARVVEAGFELHWNVCLDNRHLADAPILVEMKEREFGGTISVGIPNHCVNRRMWDYESLRPSERDVATHLTDDFLAQCEWPKPVGELTEDAWLRAWHDDPKPFEPRYDHDSWPPDDPFTDLSIEISADRSIRLAPLGAPKIHLGHLADGRAAIEDRLRALPCPELTITPDEAATVLSGSPLLHTSPLSVRNKVVATLVHDGAVVDQT